MKFITLGCVALDWWHYYMSCKSDSGFHFSSIRTSIPASLLSFLVLLSRYRNMHHPSITQANCPHANSPPDQ